MSLFVIAVHPFMVAVGSAQVDGQPPIIADIVVEGGVTLTVDTVAYYLGLEPGDELDTGQGFNNSYEESKFQAELEVLRRQGSFPITRFRPERPT